MNGLLDNVNVQIQRAISEAIHEPVLPQFHASFRSLTEQSAQQEKTVSSQR